MATADKHELFAPKTAHLEKNESLVFAPTISKQASRLHGHFVRKLFILKCKTDILTQDVVGWICSNLQCLPNPQFM